LLFFIFAFYRSYEIYKASITNSVIFLFELEFKQFKISKILPMWKIGVYIVLLILKNSCSTISYFFLLTNIEKDDIDIYFKSLMA